MNTDPQTPASASAPPSAELSPSEATRGARKRFLPMIIVLTVLIIAAVATYYFVAIRPYESTDDAFIDGHAIQISPQVSGHALTVFIHDNQFVKKGGPLIQIDPRDYDVALAQARANLTAAQSRLAEARHQVLVSRAKAEQDRAAVGVAEAEATRAQDDLARYQSVESRAVSRQQVDTATAAARASVAALEEARKKADASEAQVGQEQARCPPPTLACNKPKRPCARPS